MRIRWVAHTAGAFDFPIVTLYGRIVYHKLDRQFDREKASRFERPEEPFTRYLTDLFANGAKPVNLLVSFVLTPGESLGDYAADC